MCFMVRTNEFKYEWLESGSDLWGVRCGGDVEMYVAWSKKSDRRPRADDVYKPSPK